MSRNPRMSELLRAMSQVAGGKWSQVRVSVFLPLPPATSYLEIELHSNLREPRQEDRGRPLPRGEGVVDRQHRVDVEQVVDVEIERRLRAAESQDLADSHVHLVQALPVQGAWLHDRHRQIRDAARESAAQ